MDDQECLWCVFWQLKLFAHSSILILPMVQLTTANLVNSTL